MKIFSYKMFATSAEFEQWQRENAEIDIAQITPFVQQMDGTTVGMTDSAWTPTFGCFVVYWANTP